MKHPTTVAAVVGMIGLLLTASASAGPVLSRLPHLVDKDGRIVGGVLDAPGGSPIVLRRERGTMVLLGASPDGTGLLGYGEGLCLVRKQ
jgi:hypothetical protein